MDCRFQDSKIQTCFNRLSKLGVWPMEQTPSGGKGAVLLISRTLAQFQLLVMIILQSADLHFGKDELRKVTFNLCTSLLVWGSLFKIAMLNLRKKSVNELRFLLSRDSSGLESEEDISVLDAAFRKHEFLRLLCYVFFMSCILFIGISYQCAHFYGTAELPFAAFLPTSYAFALWFEALCATTIGVVSVEGELIPLGFVFQLIAHYNILMNKLNKLDEVYGYEKDGEADEGLLSGSSAKVRRRKESVVHDAKEIIRFCVERHLQLMEYTARFESIFSYNNFVLMFGAFVLPLMNGMELILFSDRIGLELFSRVPVIIILLSDYLLLSHYISQVTFQCLKVGFVAYSTAWYRMDECIKRGLYMIMINSRRSPRLTAGKIIQMNMPMYMHLLRNILSWLMLLRQLVN